MSYSIGTANVLTGNLPPSVHEVPLIPKKIKSNIPNEPMGPHFSARFYSPEPDQKFAI
jgi:hypothetical protein